jgi:peptidoglycan hydrolase-like protein with peptidoglycan-binding domain
MSSSIQTQGVRSKAVKLASTGDLIAAFCQGFSGRFGAKLSNLALVRLFSVLLSLAILSYASAAMALLRQGDTGPEVSDLQNRLTAAQCYSGQVTGYFGTLTLDAVMQCQRKLGVEADGIVGPRTLAALTGERSLPTNLATLQKGSSGSAVTELQRQLVSWGYDTGGIDGLFGGKTEAAVMALQRARGLAATGVVADRERQILAQQPTPATPVGQTVSRALTTGDSGTEVELLQRRLREQNYFDSPVTGYFGPITREAVVSFQAAQRLPATGVADTSTLAALGLARSNTQAYNPPAAAPASGFAKGGFTTGSGAVQFTGISRYVVVIPKKSGATLGQVRGIVANAFEDSSKLGDFIQTGAFVSQAAAEQQSRQLQAYGLDARVAYRQ